MITLLAVHGRPLGSDLLSGTDTIKAIGEMCILTSGEGYASMVNIYPCAQNYALMNLTFMQNLIRNEMSG